MTEPISVPPLSEVQQVQDLLSFASTNQKDPVKIQQYLNKYQEYAPQSRIWRAAAELAQFFEDTGNAYEEMALNGRRVKGPLWTNKRREWLALARNFDLTWGESKDATTTSAS